MRDVELYCHLLGLEEPWTVRSVELKVAEQRVDVCHGLRHQRHPALRHGQRAGVRVHQSVDRESARQQILQKRGADHSTVAGPAHLTARAMATSTRWRSQYDV